MKTFLKLLLIIFTFTTVQSQEDTSILPITIIDFNYNSDLEHLEWQVVNSVNFSHFEVERSVNDLNDWVYVGQTSDSPFSVSLEDGLNYFRMKMVDLDGSFEYSSVVTGVNVEDFNMRDVIKYGDYYTIYGKATNRRKGQLLIRYKSQFYRIYIL